MSATEIGKGLEQLLAFCAGTEWTDLPEAVQKGVALPSCA